MLNKGLLAAATFLSLGILGLGYVFSQQLDQNKGIPNFIDKASPTPLKVDDTQMLALINRYRTEKGLPNLSSDSETCKIAKRMLSAIPLEKIELNDYADLCSLCNSLGNAQYLNYLNLDNEAIINAWKADSNTLKNLNGDYSFGCSKHNEYNLVFAFSKKNSEFKANPIAETNKVDTDPLVNCTIHPDCGGGTRQMKKSECDNSICCLISSECGGNKVLTKVDCDNSTCCQVGSSWSMYLNRASCTLAQNNYYNAYKNAQLHNYPPCSVYYPSLGYSQTYYNIAPSQCSLWQQQANSNSTYTAPIYTPLPSPDDSSYQDLLNQHAEACKQAVAEWNGLKEQFYETEYDNFSSSYEAIQELERRRKIYQQELYSAGCAQTIYL